MTTYIAGENTKTKMINAAGELAAKIGFDNVSTRAIAERSGENIGSIHYHFGGKKGLWVAVVREAMQGCVQVTKELGEEGLDENASPVELSKTVRTVISKDSINLFRSGRPAWNAQVIYHLIQCDDDLYVGPLFQIIKEAEQEKRRDV